MDPITQQGLAGSAGAGGDPLYVDDVFSTFLYEGNAGSSQTITNGIDLSGEGGLVWLKNRDATDEHTLIDTERGATKYLMSHSTYGEQTNSGQITSFNSNGFSLGAANQVNRSGNDFVSWTFRKAKGFFDIVTFTGTGSVQNISHSLGSVPGMIIVKKVGTTDVGPWHVYHRSLGANGIVYLHSTSLNSVDNGVWNNTAPTSSVFTVGADAGVNGNGATYIAYVFAHDDQSFGTNSDEAIIKCGSYAGTGSSMHNIDVGFEPQLVIFKNITRSYDWFMLDTMRGLTDGGNDQYFYINTSSSESNSDFIYPTPTGFGFNSTGNATNDASDTYIYMVIRRPHKPPTAATEVFGISVTTGSGEPSATSSFPVDMAIRTDPDISQARANSGRLIDGKFLYTSSTNSEASSTNFSFDYQNGVSFISTTNFHHYMFKRAPGFFDAVTYRGTGSTQNINHNLGSVPELIICKNRELAYDWTIYTSITNQTKRLRFNNLLSTISSTSWNDTAPTSSVFTVGSHVNVNADSNTKHLAYLFATLDGISKVGSYTGTGSNINVDCGFAAGARFILIKRTDNTGNWYVFDTTNGITSGNEAWWQLDNFNGYSPATLDYIDPLNAGFTVTSSAPAALNASGGTYLFLAIA